MMCSLRCMLLAVCLLIGAGHSDGVGQSAISRSALYDVEYRPGEATYRVAHYPHFDVVFQRGTEQAAYQMATHLENSLPATNALVGRTHGRLHMPVIVNGYNDRSNGFVSPLPFRQEIEAPSIKSDALTTYFPSWPASVAPHELVHAAHADLNAGIGIGGLVRTLAPDWSRVINLTAPLGLIEGVAVYRESQLHPRAGRLHSPLATMTYRAAMLSDDPWSLTQMLEAPSYTRPFDRHYVGGGQAFNYLAQQDGAGPPRFFHRATRFHHRLPLLGFGAALWYGTGEPTHVLADRMQEELVSAARVQHQGRAPFTEPTLIDGAGGLEYRRPHWVDDSTLVAHAAGYAVRPGFYAVHAETGQRRLISPQRMTEDAVTSLGRDSTFLYFARYVADPLVPRQFRAEVHRLDLRTGAATRLTRDGRAHAPVESPDGALWALPNDGPYNQWGVVQPDGTVTPLTALEGVRFEQIAPSPDGETVAVVLNVRGQQRLYQALTDGQGPPRLVPWIGFAEGAIYDVSWGPQGRYLVFAADPDGTANVYAFDTTTEHLVQLTHVAFGALEPTVSPDGSTLAFVHYRHERFDLVRMPFRPGAGEPVPDEQLAARSAPGWLERTTPTVSLPVRPPDQVTAYRAATHLAPRLVFPTIAYDIEQQGDPLGLKLGVGLAGADPLRRWAYRAETFYRAERLWGRLNVQTGRWWLRPRLALYNAPYAVGQQAVEERGASLRVGTPITLARNVHLTQVIFSIESAVEQARRIDASGQGLTDFTSQWMLRPQAVLGYRLEQNIRDLVPNRGAVWRSVAEADLWSNRQRRRGLRTSLRVYLPLLTAYNTGFSVYGRLLTQNRGAVLGGSPLLPRGYPDEVLPQGTFGSVGAEIIQPLTYVDDGMTTVPLYIKALYAYGFSETVQGLRSTPFTRSSVGGGLGVRARLFYMLDVDLRLGLAYRPQAGDMAVILR